MHRDPLSLDEYTLAAFLAGTLPEDRRAEVLAYLAEHDDARELLCMAEEALAVAEAPVAAPFALPRPAPAEDRRPQAPARRRSGALLAASLALTLLVAGGLYLSRPAPDRFRSTSEAPAPTLVAEVSTEALQFQWTPVPEAYYYRLVILEPEVAAVVAQHETRETRLGRDDAFVLSLLPHLQPNRRYSLRVDAIDVQNRLVQSSEAVVFELPQ
ncbi:MAG: hypothetical protein R3247_10235 [Rhodothermales bacterium]|nr:hypothetical protein [Rhodothermales bacterium]